VGGRIWAFDELEDLHFDDEQDVHISSEDDEENGFGPDSDLSIISHYLQCVPTRSGCTVTSIHLRPTYLK
jgi:hypothetical protein